MHEEELAGYRQEIDAIDEQILALLNRRLQVVGAIGEAKLRRGAPVFHAAREEAVVHRLQQVNAGPLSSGGIALIWGEIMAEARRLQDVMVRRHQSGQVG